jgi:NADPH:quinone reductase-like Zn-dependent oxidoreductase
LKAVVIDGYGGPEVLNVRDVPVPEITEDQVLVKVKAAGINPADWKIREGYLAKAFPHKLPLTPGWELSGIVEAVGNKGCSFKPGDEVYAYVRLETVQFGTYAEFAPADASMLAIKPAKLSFSDAATIPLTVLTAWQAMVDFAALQAGESVFVTAGAGGVGGFAIQIAKHLGARVCAAASPHNHDYLRSLGADEVIDYRQDDIKASIETFATEGVDFVFDCTGREDVAINFDYVRKNYGRVATINGLVHTVAELEKNAAKHNVAAKLIVVEPDGKQLSAISKLIETGKIKPLPVETFPMAQVKEALQKSQNGHVRGKLALIIS